MGFVFRPISIHAPHTGRDLTQSISRICITQFQSTRPIRGATKPMGNGCGAGCPYFNPRAPYGARRERESSNGQPKEISIHAPHTGRDAGEVRPHRSGAISIHAPHTGRDKLLLLFSFKLDKFQSTRPIRGATAKMHNLCSAFCNNRQLKHKNQQETSSVRTFF